MVIAVCDPNNVVVQDSLMKGSTSGRAQRSDFMVLIIKLMTITDSIICTTHIDGIDVMLAGFIDAIVD